MEKEFSGYMPKVHKIELSSPHSMITNEGGLIKAHTLKMVVGENEEVFYSLTTEDLQKLYFTILKILTE
jgi:hypothetical protein